MTRVSLYRVQQVVLGEEDKDVDRSELSGAEVVVIVQLQIRRKFSQEVFLTSKKALKMIQKYARVCFLLRVYWADFPTGEGAEEPVVRMDEELDVAIVDEGEERKED
ncbi:unnamed protein product [Calicophoron daubneyi]|uniref:Uncharacterized protein n=1 Tax=Calicophoron daubneyi TaxID=300641 RepID=A0AAV2T2I3_CALDB